MAIPFVKMHGLGNDYVFLDAVTRPELGLRADLAELAVAISDRRRGVGSDGLIVIGPATPGAGAEVRMRIFNADGGEAEMCGNGVRCVAKFAHDRLGLTHAPLRVEVGTSRRRVLSIDLTLDASGRAVGATVDMGAPVFDPAGVPFRPEFAGARRECGFVAGLHEYALEAPGAGATFWTLPVSIGNPHAVIFLPSTPEGRSREALAVGPLLERHPAFPQRVNVHFVEIAGRGAASMWTWERGAGATQACGTGACAVVAAGVASGRLDRDVELTLPGGVLRVRWDEATDHLFKTGPAQEVFEGEWLPPPPGVPARAGPAIVGECRSA